jgi:6-pyruvoyltetrahydropterin/6-carboxytetrahydropterin synthase
MYQLCLQREFEASHFLIGGDWGAENEIHAHRYRLEWILEGHQLDKHGYLVDLTNVDEHLAAVLSRYRGKVSNDLPEFSGINPSLEHFCGVLSDRLSPRLSGSSLQAHIVRLWESETAWAALRQAL